MEPSRAAHDAEALADELAYRSGVGILLLNARGDVFVARRIDTDVEAWQMPQGGIDEGESPLEAAWREMGEEIGTTKAELLAESRGWLRYDLPAELAATVWRGRFRGQAQKWFAFRFTGRDEDIDIATAHPEFCAWKWMKPALLPSVIIPFKRQLYIDVLAEFRHLL